MTRYDADADAIATRRIRLITVTASAIAALCTAFLFGYAAHGSPRPVSAASSTQPMTAGSAAASPLPGPVRHDATVSDLRRNPEGVIIGYPHSQTGAIAAAGNYTAALYVQANRTGSRELAVLSTIATSNAGAARMAGDFSSEDAALSKLLDVPNLQTDGVIAYGHPVGYRVAAYSLETATVDVYVVGGQGVAGSPQDAAGGGETFYEVDRVDLSWAGQDWRMSNWSHLSQANEPELASVAAEGYRPFPIGIAS